MPPSNSNMSYLQLLDSKKEENILSTRDIMEKKIRFVFSSVIAIYSFIVQLNITWIWNVAYLFIFLEILGNIAKWIFCSYPT